MCVCSVLCKCSCDKDRNDRFDLDPLLIFFFPMYLMAILTFFFYHSNYHLICDVRVNHSISCCFFLIGYFCVHLHSYRHHSSCYVMSDEPWKDVPMGPQPMTIKNYTSLIERNIIQSTISEWMIAIRKNHVCVFVPLRAIRYACLSSPRLASRSIDRA